jgi:hypothetical protein
MIGSMPVVCSNEGCGEKTTIADLNAHELKCKMRKRTCKSCGFQGMHDVFVQHITETHSKELADQWDSQIVTKKDEEKKECA